MGGGVSPDKYHPIATTMNRPVACWSDAHSCGDAHHNCTFVRFCARAREDVQGVGRTSSHAYQHLALLGGFNDLVPISLGEAPLTGKSQGSGSLEAQLSDCPAVRPRPQMHPGGAHLLAALQERHRLAGAFAAYPAPYCATGSLLGPRPKGALITSTTTRP